MPDDPPQNDPLGLFEETDKDAEPQGEPESLSPEEVAFLADLKAYDNPEIYGDPSQPQIYKLRLVNSFLPDYPTLIWFDLNAGILPDALIDAMFNLISEDPYLARTLQKYGNRNLAEFRRDFEQEEPAKLAQLREAQAKFFVQHFPKFLLSIYGIAVVSSFLGTVLALSRKEPDEGLNEVENLARTTLEKQMGNLERMVKRVVRTRASGRPPKIESEFLPEIVQQVLDIAKARMGESRGREAVPGLKAIANILDLSEDALSHRLRRARHPWTTIRSYLENQT